MEYTQEMRTFIMENHKGRLVHDLVEMFNERFSCNVTYGQLRAYKKRYGLVSGTHNGPRPQRNGSKTFPKKIYDHIVANHKGCGPKDMAQRLNERFGTSYTRDQLKSFYANHGLDSGTTGHFKKGHVPFSKGKHMADYLTPEQIEKVRSNQFKADDIPRNWRPVGTETLRPDTGIIWVKVAEPSVWEMKHRVVWEQHNGPIPKGMNIIFLDGDRSNCDISNLMMVSDAELGHINNIERLDGDVTQGRVLVYRLDRAIRRKTDENDDGRTQCGALRADREDQ